jgi:FHS family L-fucose permease-like MFS transporter
MVIDFMDKSVTIYEIRWSSETSKTLARLAMPSIDSATRSPRSVTESPGLVALGLIVSLFFLWGVANNLNDILIKQFKKAFELSDFEAGLVQSAFYMGYFLLAIPASVCTRRLGYKGTLLIGLSLYAAGAFLFYPAAATHLYGLFLTALFIIASGLAFLETSANPLVTVLGPADGAARRLNLAQSFNPLGSITGVLIGQHFIFSAAEIQPAALAGMGSMARHDYYVSQSAAVQIPYLVIGIVVLLWAVLIARMRLPATAEHITGALRGGSHIRHLMRNSAFWIAVVAQFFYVGAQVCIWSYLIRYVQVTLANTPERGAANFLMLALVAFMVGRFVGTWLMRYFAPSRLLAVFAAIDIALVSIAIVVPGWIGVYALVVNSFFMSIMFPTIFALGLNGLSEEERKLGSSFLVMAIIGGAILPAVMGAVSDIAGIQQAMAVPMLSFAVVLAFALGPRTPSPP